MMSSLARRRWQNFKAKKRGYWSLWIIASLMIISLFAEFIANDKPIVMTYKGDVYFPVLVTYTETTFGGVFETEAVYRSDPVRQMISDSDGWMLWPLALTALLEAATGQIDNLVLPPFAFAALVLCM